MSPARGSRWTESAMEPLGTRCGLLRQQPVAVDDGSPLGWIDDTEVSYVGAGRLRAVDQAGHVRTLSNAEVDAAHGIVAMSPL